VDIIFQSKLYQSLRVRLIISDDVYVKAEPKGKFNYRIFDEILITISHHKLESLVVY